MKNLIPVRINIRSNLYLRSVTLDDAESFFIVIKESQSHFSNFEFKSPTFTEMADVESIIQSLNEAQKNGLSASFGLWHDDRLIGLFTINTIDWDKKTADIGLWLIESATGKGLAFYSLQSLIKSCWNDLGMKTITAHTAISNIQCQRLLEKTNFVKTQLFKNHIKVRGQFVDEYKYLLDLPDEIT
jgi:ribosomal-protein-serine acetyltransferase